MASGAAARAISARLKRFGWDCGSFFDVLMSFSPYLSLTETPKQSLACGHGRPLL
ncbi:hypothetical protein ACTMU2_04480 [Cupriavidus basilensis]